MRGGAVNGALRGYRGAAQCPVAEWRRWPEPDKAPPLGLCSRRLCPQRFCNTKHVVHTSHLINFVMLSSVFVTSLHYAHPVWESISLILFSHSCFYRA